MLGINVSRETLYCFLHINQYKNSNIQANQRLAFQVTALDSLLAGIKSDTGLLTKGFLNLRPAKSVRRSSKHPKRYYRPSLLYKGQELLQRINTSSH